MDATLESVIKYALATTTSKDLSLYYKLNGVQILGSGFGFLRGGSKPPFLGSDSVFIHQSLAAILMKIELACLQDSGIQRRGR